MRLLSHGILTWIVRIQVKLDSRLIYRISESTVVVSSHLTELRVRPDTMLTMLTESVGLFLTYFSTVIM